MSLELRDKIYPVRLTKTEKEQLEKEAADNNMKLSEYIRFRLLCNKYN